MGEWEKQNGQRDDILRLVESMFILTCSHVLHNTMSINSLAARQKCLSAACVHQSVGLVDHHLGTRHQRTKPWHPLAIPPNPIPWRPCRSRRRGRHFLWWGTLRHRVVDVCRPQLRHAPGEGRDGQHLGQDLQGVDEGFALGKDFEEPGGGVAEVIQNLIAHAHDVSSRSLAAGSGGGPWGWEHGWL